MVGDKVYYLRAAGPDDPEAEGFPRARRALYVWSMKDRKETELGRFDAYDISANGKRMLLREKKDYSLIDLPSAKIDLKPENKLAIAGLDVRVDHHAEWKQIYHECWRQMRDFFYDPNMHGVDWKAMQAKYAALLPWVNHRNDLTYLVAEMISELNIGHAYVGGGERPEVPRLRMGLLGAEYERDASTKAYKITRILRGENWNERTRAPLTEIGLNVREGEYILAVNGRPVSQLVNLQEALIGTVGKQVSLRVSSKPTDDASARDVVVVPIGDEGPLYYYAWVQRNIDYVSKKTGGRVGYLHIPDMGVPGLNEFAKYYYPQTRKKALVVDVRGNGGGNVSPQIIERLRRELVMVNIARNSIPATNPGAMIYGPLVTLMDEFSASDGDIFPYRFKTLKMGKLIGKRSWGGVVGIRNALPLADGGTLNRPEFAPYNKDGSGWVIEGYGVDPDIVVDNDPAKEFKGEDQQLDRAIAEITKDLEANPKELPPVPPYPKKDK